jgi:hypothetical protein
MEERTSTVESGSLPAVIRPRPLLLRGLEELVERHDRFAERLAARPEQVEAIARVIHGHDAAARERFADPAALVAHLRLLLAGTGA